MIDAHYRFSHIVSVVEIVVFCICSSIVACKIGKIPNVLAGTALQYLCRRRRPGLHPCSVTTFSRNMYHMNSTQLDQRLSSNQARRDTTASRLQVKRLHSHSFVLDDDRADGFILCVSIPEQMTLITLGRLLLQRNQCFEYPRGCIAFFTQMKLFCEFVRLPNHEFRLEWMEILL